MPFRHVGGGMANLADHELREKHRDIGTGHRQTVQQSEEIPIPPHPIHLMRIHRRAVAERGNPPIHPLLRRYRQADQQGDEEEKGQLRHDGTVRMDARTIPRRAGRPIDPYQSESDFPPCCALLSCALRPMRYRMTAHAIPSCPIARHGAD